QRCNLELTGFRNSQGRLDRFQIAHFADQHYIRVLAQRRTQRLCKPVRVGIYFALVDDAALVIVKELDRVFDRQDVFVTFLVDLVDDRGERCRLAGPGWPSDQYQSSRFLTKLDKY